MTTLLCSPASPHVRVVFGVVFSVFISFPSNRLEIIAKRGNFTRLSYNTSFGLYEKKNRFKKKYHSVPYTESPMLSFLIDIFGVRAKLFSSKPLRK